MAGGNPGVRQLLAGGADRVQQGVDSFFTNYLRNTTTDQEILDFYGDGKIVGRKGKLDRESAFEELKSDDFHRLADQRPRGERALPANRTVVDMPGAVNPASGRPWQLRFSSDPFDRGTGGTPTLAASRFAADFRVPLTGSRDYGFEVSPNVEDVRGNEISRIVNDPGMYRDRGAAIRARDAGLPPSEWGKLWGGAQENINAYQGMESGVLRQNGEMDTPESWRKKGYETPQGLKNQVLGAFKEQIMKAEKPFGSVSQLTPIPEDPETLRPGGDVNWRANLYEKEGLAGPRTKVTIPGAYGPMSNDVQYFVRGNERLLPIQPLSEFIADKWEARPSAVGGEPAPDFTPFQKAIGTRNFLIGRNILEGRGSLGAPVRATRGAAAALAESPGGALAGAALAATNPEVARQVERGRYRQAARTVARDTALGAVAEAGIRAATPLVQRYAPAVARVAAPVARVAAPVAVGAALFNQGRTGSLTNVLVDKASRQVPGLRSNPQTDLGRRAGNELMYVFNQIRRGRTPYMGR